MYTDKKIEITKKEGGTLKVPGVTHESINGMAITMQSFGYFDVTHIPTGLRLFGCYERMSNALLDMAKMAAILKDCGIDPEVKTLKEELQAFKDRPVVFDKSISVKDWVEDRSAKSFTGNAIECCVDLSAAEAIDIIDDFLEN